MGNLLLATVSLEPCKHTDVAVIFGEGLIFSTSGSNFSESHSSNFYVSFLVGSTLKIFFLS